MEWDASMVMNPLQRPSARHPPSPMEMASLEPLLRLASCRTRSRVSR